MCKCVFCAKNGLADDRRRRKFPGGAIVSLPGEEPNTNELDFEIHGNSRGACVSARA